MIMLVVIFKQQISNNNYYNELLVSVVRLVDRLSTGTQL
jgi:hypothetical protein